MRIDQFERQLTRMRVTIVILLMLFIGACSFAAVQYIVLVKLRYDVREGNKTTCDEGYVAKIVDGSQVTCVMMRVGPGMVTHKVVAKGSKAKVKNVSLTEKESKNVKKLNHSVSFRIGQFGDGWVR